MPPQYAVAVHIIPRFEALVRPRSLAALARRTLGAEEVTSPAALGLVVTDDRIIRKLNRDYRGMDAPTDVLSFGLDSEGAFPTPTRGARHLGEVVISYPTAARQAKTAGHAVEEELAHLLVHGVLHLLGYDHETAREERAMRAREEALLGRLVH